MIRAKRENMEKDTDKDMNETSLIFTGDIGFDKYMDGKWEDENLLSPEILHFLHSADHVIANVEGPLLKAAPSGLSSPAGMAQGTAQLLHTMNPAAVKVLKAMRADIWNICNNHIMDAGEKGLAATIRQAQEAGASTIGAGMNIYEAREPKILREAGGIGLFGVGYQRGCKPAGEEKGGCLNWNDMESIQHSINLIRSKCRWCIIVAHAGEEFTSLPSPYTRDRYLQYLRMGADIVVAHHPHVPMNYELAGEKAIFYSLGNFIFDTDYQRAQYNTERGVLLKLLLSPEGWSFEPFGIRIDRQNERIVKEAVPDIFENVPEGEYRLLEPLAAKMFIAATKRQQIYLHPEEFENADEAKWKEHFANPRRSGRVEGEALDFKIITEIAAEEAKGDWKQSRLEKVKKYILDQM